MKDFVWEFARDFFDIIEGVFIEVGTWEALKEEKVKWDGALLPTGEFY